MERYNIDFNGISKLLELCKTGRSRKVAKLWYVNKMSVEDIAKAMGYANSVITTEILIINRLIENNISKKVCSQCGEIFYTDGKNPQICAVCKEKNKKERYEQLKSVYKTKAKPVKDKRKAVKSIQIIQKELAKYNKEHGTCLSYGQYVSMVGE